MHSPWSLSVAERNSAGTSGASAKVHRMGRRLLLAALVVSAPVADAAGAHTAAFWALVAAVPFAAGCGLASFGLFVDDRADAARGLQALLWGPALALLLAAAAARGPALATGDVPPLGVTAVVGCLAILALKTLVHIAASVAAPTPRGRRYNVRSGRLTPL